jgi:large subunit ribosomal protein L14
MIKIGSRVRVIDNSGAKFGRCLSIYKNQKFAKLGDIILITVKKIKPNKKVKKGEKHKALVVRTKYKYYRNLFNHEIWCDSDAIVLLKKDSYDLLGTRILGPAFRELLPPKSKKVVIGGTRASKKQFNMPSYKKVLSLASYII